MYFWIHPLQYEEAGDVEIEAFSILSFSPLDFCHKIFVDQLVLELGFFIKS